MQTAVLVIDMQNGFISPGGSVPSAMGALPGIDAAADACASLLADARAAGVPVVYTRHQWRPGYLDAPATVLDRFPPGARPLVAGSWDAAVADLLAPQPGDVLVDKNRYDAFLYTDLELVLRALSVRRLVVTGVVTNICVESTVRSAHMRDFEVAVASDCTAAPAGFHVPALASMAAAFASVAPGRAALADMLAAPATLAA
jgi:ureidoacrylate peracid hydrolase